MVLRLLWSWCTLEYSLQAYIPRLLLLPDLLDDAGLSSNKRERASLEAGYLVSTWLAGRCSNCHRHRVPWIPFFLAERGK